MCQIARRKELLEKDKVTARNSAGSFHITLVYYKASSGLLLF